MKKTQLTALAMITFFALGCGPTDEPPVAPDAAPTAPPSDAQITDMDFESGETEEVPSEAEQPDEDPTPDVP